MGKAQQGGTADHDRVSIEGKETSRLATRSPSDATPRECKDASLAIKSQLSAQGAAARTAPDHPVPFFAYGVVSLRGRGHRSGGESFDALEVHTWHVAGGKLTETRVMSPDQAADEPLSA